MARELTEQQQRFLDALFTDEAKGDVRKAMRIAGYKPTSPSSTVTGPLADEIAALTNKFIAQSATKAAFSMFEVMDDPVQLGNKDKLSAARDILDRAGFTKTEKVQITASEPLFILPAKQEDQEDD